MAIETGFYGNLKQQEMPSLIDNETRAQNLTQLARQGKSFERDDAYKAHMQKASVFGEALDSISGLKPEQRAAAWPKIASELVNSGVIKPQDVPPEHDEGFYRQTLNRYYNSEPYLAKKKTQAEISNLYAQAGKTKKEGLPTQSQFSAATFGTRASQAEDVFGELAKEGFDPTSKSAAIQRSLPGLLEGFKSENAKKQDQAERNFVNSILRRESGAAISPDEFASAEKQYFPRVGDSPEVLKQKELNRKTVAAALQAEGMPALSKIGAQMSGMRLGSSVPKQNKDDFGEFNVPGISSANAAPPSKMIRMQAPDGSIKMIPASQKREAIAAGGKVVK